MGGFDSGRILRLPGRMWIWPKYGCGWKIIQWSESKGGYNESSRNRRISHEIKKNNHKVLKGIFLSFVMVLTSSNSNAFLFHVPSKQQQQQQQQQQRQRIGRRTYFWGYANANTIAVDRYSSLHM